MKEAAGEANMTVITIVLIAAVLGIGTILVRNVMKKTESSSTCVSEGGVVYGGACCYKPVYNSDGKVTSCNSYTKAQ